MCGGLVSEVLKPTAATVPMTAETAVDERRGV